MFGALFFLCCSSPDANRTVISDLPLTQRAPQITPRDYVPFSGQYFTTFNDSTELHMHEAIKHGFDPLQQRQDTMAIDKHFVNIANEQSMYKLDTLTHSVPLLVPIAAQLLNDIATNFRDSLIVRQLAVYLPIVTSVTRTATDIKGLRRRNRNAIEESAHRYGTTFDLTWMRYEKMDTLDTHVVNSGILKRLLGEVLNDLRQEERCYVKYERHQACFHITVRKK